MSKKHSAASKNRWKDIPKEERSRIMSARLVKMWKNIPAKERKKVAMRMVRARQAKKIPA